MKIIVCVKQVPDTTEVRLDPVTGTLLREGIPSIINPDDKAGLEAALRLKDRYEAHVTVLTMGPPQADLALREALAMGADAAILLTDRAFGGADTWATSSTLASALSALEYDLIITGRQAIDGDTAQVGPQIAEHLGIPNISYAEELRIEGNTVVVKRQYEDRSHILRAEMPCLVTALSELNEPRYMTPRGIFEAFRDRTVKILTRADLAIDDGNIGLKGSPTRVMKSFTKAVRGKGTVVELDARDAAGWITERLQEKFVL
ncbi:electron transfer flavoprotein subunit beta/FixA family protein [Aminivibrio sp.]|jgi:electron transfer flavoprotein beta subunit|uniref:electron transfer flavoprotein subunit beta/FixA family protein n=1 Tax=Aminivibrio sp. TaxID=1872489 RepID=UPI001A4510AF|nr:electron transfer flavoprotein subunit beta/FixA family protein [Aminivibrio sp.]MBL3538180.1 electron transfer flavoprotein subunit beta/FixA family protein [Aminivibrio sp.]